VVGDLTPPHHAPRSTAYSAAYQVLQLSLGLALAGAGLSRSALQVAQSEETKLRVAQLASPWLTLG
jgi:hypothetical protein